MAEGCGKLRGLRDALLIRLMSDGMLRVSEAEALDVADLALSKGKLLVTIRRSKTDEDGRGVVFRGGPDTMRLARTWLDATGIKGGPVFRPVNKAGRVGDTKLSARSVRQVVKDRAADAGIDGRVSGHSLRVGSAQSLRDRGATTADLMDAGRWSRVETMAVYVRAQDAALGPMARLRYGVEQPSGRGSRPRPRGKARAAGRERRWARQGVEAPAKGVEKSREKGLHASKEPCRFLNSGFAEPYDKVLIFIGFSVFVRSVRPFCAASRGSARRSPVSLRKSCQPTPSVATLRPCWDSPHIEPPCRFKS